MNTYLVTDIKWPSLIISKRSNCFYVRATLRRLDQLNTINATVLVVGRVEDDLFGVGRKVVLGEPVRGCFRLEGYAGSNISYTQKDMFSSDFKDHSKIIPVNLKGVAGAGLALYWKKKYPDQFTEYKILCQHAELTHLTPVRMGVNILLPTKDEWWNPSDVVQITEALIGLRYLILREADKHKYIMPPIGCGRGELDFKTQVKPLIDSILKDVPSEIVVSTWKR